MTPTPNPGQIEVLCHSCREWRSTGMHSPGPLQGSGEHVLTCGHSVSISEVEQRHSGAANAGQN